MTYETKKSAAFFYKECKRTQRMQCSFIKNVKEHKERSVLFIKKAKERENVSFLWKERKRTQKNARTLHSFENNGCPTLVIGETNKKRVICRQFDKGFKVKIVFLFNLLYTYKLWQLCFETIGLTFQIFLLVPKPGCHVARNNKTKNDTKNLKSFLKINKLRGKVGEYNLVVGFKILANICCE